MPPRPDAGTRSPTSIDMLALEDVERARPRDVTSSRGVWTMGAHLFEQVDAPPVDWRDARDEDRHLAEDGFLTRVLGEGEGRPATAASGARALGELLEIVLVA